MIGAASLNYGFYILDTPSVSILHSPVISHIIHTTSSLVQNDDCKDYMRFGLTSYTKLVEINKHLTCPKATKAYIPYVLVFMLNKKNFLFQIALISLITVLI